jgi:hypothetical protein
MIRIIMNIHGGIDGFRVIGFEKHEKSNKIKIEHFICAIISRQS